ncbi:lamin tail domain-containing protein [Patescibacteria group bacterium]|nr:lamin tail domain-containing protein [Patescibacteria group bacterium]
MISIMPKTKIIFLITTILLLLKPVSEAGNLEISEVFPNPKGKDQNQEYIEFFNSGPSPINLKEWIIQKNGTKSKIKEDFIISPNQYKSLKTTLPNKESTLQFITPSSQIYKTISYPQAPENQSYTHISDKYIWTIPTENQKNPHFQIFQGKFKDLITEIHIPQNRQKFLSLIISPNASAKILALKLKNHYFLQKIQITNPPSPKKPIPKEPTLPILIISIPLLLLILHYSKQ